jgi:hypoxanthine phosphoribosyltransferase
VILKEILSSAELQRGVHDMARRINEDFADQPLTIIGIMTGSIVLLADLIRLLEMPLRVGVMQASSYRDSTERGQLTINSEMMPDVRDRNVLLVDDILDSGYTLKEVMALARRLGPKSLQSAVLLRKVGRQEVEYSPDYVGFEIPDEFVVGYGLDYQDAYRNLPYLAALEPDDISEEPI